MKPSLTCSVLAATLACAACAQTVQAPLQVGGDVIAPKLLKHPDIDAPRNIGGGDEAGEATISLVVDAKGHVASAHLLTSSGNAAFDSGALSAARKYVFAPATREGKRVAVQISIAMNFRTHVLR